MARLIKEYYWQWIAGGLLLAALLSSRAGMASIVALGRVLLPILAVLFLFRLVKRKLSDSFGKHIRAAFEAQQGARGAAGAGGRVIDLCPKCGKYLQNGHRCG